MARIRGELRRFTAAAPNIHIAAAALLFLGAGSFLRPAAQFISGSTQLLLPQPAKISLDAAPQSSLPTDCPVLSPDQRRQLAVVPAEDTAAANPD